MKYKKKVPTAVRRSVYHEAGYRCAVPGCKWILFPVIHHIVPREEDGPDEHGNLISLCPNHHLLADNGEISRKYLFELKRQINSGLIKRNTEAKIPVKRLIQEIEENYSLGYVEGAFAVASKILGKYRIYSPSEAELDLISRVYLAMGNVQLQRGMLDFMLGAKSVCRTCKKLFDLQKNRDGLARSHQLDGLIHRVERDFSGAIKSYDEAYKLAKHLSINPRIRHHICHDKFVSVFLYNSRGLENYLYTLESYSSFFENYFLEEGSPFYHLSLVRKAEMYLYAGKMKAASRLLKPLEEEAFYKKLPVAQQAIFLRVNTEYYLLQNDAYCSELYFGLALKLNKKQGYRHQLEELRILYNRFKNVFLQFLPEDFDLSETLNLDRNDQEI